MTSDGERWRRIQQRFAELRRLLGDDPRLRDRTERMLAGDLDAPDLEDDDRAEEEEEDRDAPRDEEEGDDEAPEPGGRSPA